LNDLLRGTELLPFLLLKIVEESLAFSEEQKKEEVVVAVAVAVVVVVVAEPDLMLLNLQHNMLNGLLLKLQDNTCCLSCCSPTLLLDSDSAADFLHSVGPLLGAIPRLVRPLACIY
jgi:hypothetical protein